MAISRLVQFYPGVYCYIIQSTKILMLCLSDYFSTDSYRGLDKGELIPNDAPLRFHNISLLLVLLQLIQLMLEIQT